MEAIQKQELLDLFKEKRIKELRGELLTFHEVDIAEFLQDLTSIELITIFRILPKHIASDVFSYFDIKTQENLLEDITNTELTELVDKLYIDDMVDMLEELPVSVIQRVLSRLSKEKRDIVNQFLNYPEDSAGSIMTSEFIDVNKNMTVGETIEKIRKIGLKSETIYTIYITENKKLKGYVSVRSILMNKDDVIIKDLMEEDVIFVYTDEDQEEVAKKFTKYDFMALPVVDKEQKLVGLVTFDDVIDVIQEESTEDFEKMAAMSPSEKPYLKTSIFELAKNRFIWLIILLVTASITSTIINKNEKILTAVSGIIAFLPMLTDAGGNAGSQSSTMVIRGLSLGEIKTKDYLKIFVKEFGIAILVGFGLALFNFLRIYILQGDWKIGITVSSSLIVTIVLAKTVGGILPIIAQKLRLDPAVMAAPFITTLVDTLSLLVYVFFVKLILI